ncbi:Hypothetical predicted protein [Olea europaea subsp. europaea]|uniref:Agenet domain-containing protein n=1 Tax=Olea europaea subsp. europaea TaxID=158383 RepID=A0A8S0R2R9_OLEEU|nr:Hypothetical predicted protein [Olea europaea subsp. europaea]
MADIDEDTVAHYFYKGAEVEISSKEEGFQGSWYAGTVLSHRKSKRNSCMKVLVKYKTLFKDDGTRRLREEVDVLQLRPAPPPENRCSFESSENVDAYYHDGWWEGVITEVLREDKYKVFFRGSREQKNFKASQLRRHHEWAVGKWLPPFEPGFDKSPPLKRPKVEGVSMSTKVKPKKKTADNNFSPGTTIKIRSDEDRCQDASFAATSVKKSGPSEVSVATEVKSNKERILNNFCPGAPVEVSSDEDGFEGAWFPATIVKKLRKNKYLIEYQTLRNDNDTEFLREEVDTSHIRPCPPDIELLDRFEVLEKVEALYNDIWWVGVISKVRKNDKYNVYFRSSDEELGFNHSRLRAHQEWINGKWVFPSQARDL